MRQEALVVEVVDGGHPSVAVVGMALTPPCPPKRNSDAPSGVETMRSDQETRFTAHLAVDCRQDDTGR